MAMFDRLGVNNKTARSAGLLYLIVILTGIFSLAYVPSQIVDQGNPTVTVSNILTSVQLFRLGIVAGLICHTVFLLLALALYRLLSPNGKANAVLLVVFAFIQSPIFFVNVCNELDVLSLPSKADYLRAFTTEQLNAKVIVSLADYANGMLVLEIFMGLWLLPFGYLVFK